MHIIKLLCSVLFRVVVHAAGHVVNKIHWCVAVCAVNGHAECNLLLHRRPCAVDRTSPVIDPKARYWSRIAIFAYPRSQSRRWDRRCSIDDRRLVAEQRIEVVEIVTEGRQKSRFLTPLLGGSLSEYCHKVWYKKTKMVWDPMVKKNEDKLLVLA